MYLNGKKEKTKSEKKHRIELNYYNTYNKNTYEPNQNIKFVVYFIQRRASSLAT